MPRSHERAEFLQDILTTAVEGGIGYWSATSGYHWDDDAPGTAFATIHELNDETGDYSGPTHTITLDTIARGLSRIGVTGANVGLSDTRRSVIRAADREQDAGEIDADDADVIVQVALFGEVVYG